MRLCHCAAVYPDSERSVRGRPGCADCGGDGEVATPVTREQWADLVAAGWKAEGDELWHAVYGRARVEAALALMESDRKAAKRAAERTATT